MKLLIFTNNDSEESRQAQALGQELEKESYSVEYLDAESAEAQQKAELYDIYSYPSFIVIQDDGVEVECWRGTVPISSDIKFFLTR